MEYVITFLVAVAAGVACHYIIKWLDSDRKDNEEPSGCLSTIKEKTNPSTVREYGWGISFFVHMERYNFSAYGNYSIRGSSLQYVISLASATP